MYRALLVMLVVAGGGCGVAPLPVESDCTNSAACAAPAGDQQSTQPASPVPVVSTATPVLFPINTTPIPSTLVDPVLSSLLDAMLIELLDPTGPLLDEDLSFLERLCREGDDPDFFCRNRFKTSSGNTP